MMVRRNLQTFYLKNVWNKKPRKFEGDITTWYNIIT